MTNIDLTTLTIPELEQLVREANAEIRIQRRALERGELDRALFDLEDDIDRVVARYPQGIERKKKGIELNGKFDRILRRNEDRLNDDAIKDRVRRVARRLLTELLGLDESEADNVLNKEADNG